MILSLSLRFAFSRTKGHLSRTVRTILMIVVSISMVMVIISIMDSLQSGRFDSIRSVRSFDAVFSGDRRGEMESLFPSKSVFLYGEGEALINGEAFLIRYIDSEYDGGIRVLMGDSSSLLVPYSSSIRGESAKITMLREGRSALMVPSTEEMEISGYYSSELGGDFDSMYAFLPLEADGGSADIKTAVKGLSDRELEDLRDMGYSFTSWKEAESSLYSAFLLERTMMYIVLSLLFVMIGVSIRSSVRIFYEAKVKERAELLILGLGKRRADAAFVLSFAIIALLGVSLSLISSLFFLSLFEYLSVFTVYGRMSLSLPWPSFVVFSLVTLSLAFLFSLLEVRRERNRDLLEMIYER